MYKLVVSFLYDPLQCSSFVLVNTQQNGLHFLCVRFGRIFICKEFRFVPEFCHFVPNGLHHENCVVIIKKKENGG